MTINTVAVIGSGTMGRGIAQAAALAGHGVPVSYTHLDVYKRQLHKYAMEATSMGR